MNVPRIKPDKAKAIGFFHVIIERGDEEIHEEFFNGITTVGLNNLLNVMFQNAAQSPVWYAGLIKGSGFTGVSAADTMASHTGWVEETNYAEANRIGWIVGAATSKIITNSVNMTFTIDTDGTTVAGIFICSSGTKSNNTGTLWSTGLFPSVQTFLANDLVKVQYTVTLAS